MTKPGPGKFEANESLEISEYLADIDADESTGDSSEWTAWYGLIIRSDMDEKFLPQVAYVVWEDSNGFFSYLGFDSVDEARAEYNQHDADYSEWLSGDEVTV